MIYLSGVPHPAIPASSRQDIGVLLTPEMGNRPDWLGLVRGWAGDTGLYHPNPEEMRRKVDRFTPDGYVAWMQSMAPWRATCLFMTVPDVIGDAPATWELSRTFFKAIREAGYPAALVAQDGLEHMLGQIEWELFDALFVGGSTEWKISQQAQHCVMEARQRGKWTHMGRVNSCRRLRLAHDHGCRSADGTFLRAAPDQNVPRMVHWLDNINRQPSLLAPAA